MARKISHPLFIASVGSILVKSVSRLTSLTASIREATTMAKNPQTRFPSVSMVGNMAMVLIGRMVYVPSPAGRGLG